MKNYKLCEKEYIGASDKATLTLFGCTDGGMVSATLVFGEDGAYQAYIADAETIIPERYKLEHKFKNWVKIYDDAGDVKTIKSDLIQIYTCGNFGCIIQLVNQSCKKAM